MYSLNNTVELHLSRIIGMASHLDMQKIQIIGFFFEWATLAVGGSAVTVYSMHLCQNLLTTPDLKF